DVSTSPSMALRSAAAMSFAAAACAVLACAVLASVAVTPPLFHARVRPPGGSRVLVGGGWGLGWVLSGMCGPHVPLGDTDLGKPDLMSQYGAWGEGVGARGAAAGARGEGVGARGARTGHLVLKVPAASGGMS